MGGTVTAPTEALGLLRSGHVNAAISLLRHHLGAAVNPDDAETRLLLARALLRAGRDREAGLVARQVLERDPSGEALAIALSITAHAALIDNEPGALDLVQDSLAESRGRGIAASIAWGSVSISRYWCGDIASAVDAARRAAAAPGPTTDFERDDFATLLAMMLIHADAVDEAGSILALPAESPAGQSLRDRIRGSWCFHTGSWDEAVHLLDGRPDAADGIEIADHDRGIATGVLIVLLVHRDRLDEADRVLSTGVSSMATGQGPLLLWGAALLAEARGDVAGATDLADRLASKLDDLRSPVRYRLVAPDLVRLRLAAGDPVVPTRVADALHQVAVNARMPSFEAAALLARGMVDADVELAAQACDLLATTRRVLDRAMALDAYSVLLAQDSGGRHPSTVDAQARALFAQLGARRDVRRIDARSRAHGGTSGRPLVEALPGCAGLSPAEAAVATLVAQGLTNAEIARRLYVSPRTVETHVAHLFTKLGVKRRAAIAGVISGAAGASRPIAE